MAPTRMRLPACKIAPDNDPAACVDQAIGFVEE